MRPDTINTAAPLEGGEARARTSSRLARSRTGAGALASKRLALAPEIVLVGASTGGPQALIALITVLAPHLTRIPTCVTLHMPADLMPVLATNVARVCQVETCVVTERRALRAGLVHFSPGDRHLEIQRREYGVEVAPTLLGARDFCMPAIDMMFQSAAKSHGPRALAIVLSGMGKDGLAGARAIVAAGGVVLAQDKASSAVWGMPGAVVQADLASAVLEPKALANDVIVRLRPLDLDP